MLQKRVHSSRFGKNIWDMCAYTYPHWIIHIQPFSSFGKFFPSCEVSHGFLQKGDPVEISSIIIKTSPECFVLNLHAKLPVVPRSIWVKIKIKIFCRFTLFWNQESFPVFLWGLFVLFCVTLFYANYADNPKSAAKGKSWRRGRKEGMTDSCVSHVVHCATERTVAVCLDVLLLGGSLWDFSVSEPYVNVRQCVCTLFRQGKDISLIFLCIKKVRE